jgi:hypothetical protein
MANQNTTNAEAKLTKLGQQLRLGWEKRPMDTEKNLETVRNAVKQQWQKERQETLAKPAPQAPAPDKAKGKDVEPPEPDLG